MSLVQVVSHAAVMWHATVSCCLHDGDGSNEVLHLLVGCILANSCFNLLLVVNQVKMTVDSCLHLWTVSGWRDVHLLGGDR